MQTNEIDHLITATSAKIWSDWYGTGPETPAKLVITHNDGITRCDGKTAYDEKADVIYLDLPLGNLTDEDVMEAAGWPIWIACRSIHVVLATAAHLQDESSASSVLWPRGKERTLPAGLTAENSGALSRVTYIG